MVSKLAPQQNTSFLIARAQETLDGFQLSKVGKISPQDPNTEFRYLGVYISLNLTHIDYITKTIHTWRWKSITEKVDPAQLTTTVTELLLPKLELGLLYAYGITERMCNKWTNTIIQTIVQDAHGENDNYSFTRVPSPLNGDSAPMGKIKNSTENRILCCYQLQKL